MSVVVETPNVGPIELRVLPRMRVARCQVYCAPNELWPIVEAVQAAVAATRVAVAGVPSIVFPGLSFEPRVHAEIRLPVSDLTDTIPATDAHPTIEFVRIDRERAACRMFSGRPGTALATAVQGLFTWVDRSGLARQGGCHHHVYMPNPEPRSINVEIRVPVQ